MKHANQEPQLSESIVIRPMFKAKWNVLSAINEAVRGGSTYVEPGQPSNSAMEYGK